MTKFKYQYLNTFAINFQCFHGEVHPDSAAKSLSEGSSLETLYYTGLTNISVTWNCWYSKSPIYRGVWGKETSAVNRGPR